MSDFPHYRQLDLIDCGPTCLRMIAKYYKKIIPYNIFANILLFRVMVFLCLESAMQQNRSGFGQGE